MTYVLSHQVAVLNGEIAFVPEFPMAETEHKGVDGLSYDTVCSICLSNYALIHLISIRFLSAFILSNIVVYFTGIKTFEIYLTLK